MAPVLPAGTSVLESGASAVASAACDGIGGTSFSGLLAQLASIVSGTRLYDIELPGASGPLAVEGFVSSAALSTLSELRILVLSTDAGLDLDALQWQPVRMLLTQSDGSRITRSGFVREAEAMESDGGLARYALTVVPWLWLLTQQTHSRIFQAKSVLEIIGEVFEGYAAAAKWQLADGTQDFIDALPRRRICSQYRETDYAFVSRLLAEEGLGFHFDEKDSASLTIFSDSAHFVEDASSQSGLGGAGIRFHRASSQQGYVLPMPKPLVAGILICYLDEYGRYVDANTYTAYPDTSAAASGSLYQLQTCRFLSQEPRGKQCTTMADSVLKSTITALPLPTT